MSKKQPVVIISGPTASGKSTLSKLLIDLDFTEIVSTTTRPIREGEVDGVDYFFVSKEKFNDMIGQDSFIEYLQVGDNFYGVSKPAIKHAFDQGKPSVIVIEPVGGNNIARFCEESDIPYYKFYVNNSISLLTERLYNRFQNDKNADIRTYEKRLWDMVMVEPVTWTQRAYNKKDHYDVIFDSFTSKNQNEVLHTVLDKVNNSLITTNRKKTKKTP